MREIVIIRVFFNLPPLLFLLPCAPVEIAPFDRFSWLMAQKTYIRVIYVTFGCQQKMLIFSTIFRVKIRKIPYSRNNSVSIEDTAVQFANSRRFSDIADRMFFTTAILLHDRK